MIWLDDSLSFLNFKFSVLNKHHSIYIGEVITSSLHVMHAEQYNNNNNNNNKDNNDDNINSNNINSNNIKILNLL